MKKSTVKQILILIPLIVFGAFMAFPFVWMITSSLKTPDEIIQVPIKWIPSEPQFRNYADIWSVTPLGRMYVNSIVVTLSITVGVLITSSMGGFALSKYRFKGRDGLFIAFLSTMMIPFFVLLIPLFFIVKEFGWTNSYLGLIAPHLANAFGIFLMRQFTMGVPDEMLQAARIDGASEWYVYWRIVLPLQRMALAALGIFVFVYNWDSFLWPLAVVSEESMSTLPLGLNMLRNAYNAQQNMNMLMTGSTIAVVPSLIVFVALQRYFVKGITMTGMKG